jgi:CBS domain containing-hemolysin-like protein
MTPSLFIFGEILPKSIFFYRADGFIRPLAPAIWSVWRICTISGAVKLMRLLFKVFSRLFRISVDTAAAVDITQRSQVRQIIQETRDEGLLTSLQKNMMQRLINIPEVSVGTVVVPMSKAEMAEVNSNRKALLAIVADVRIAEFRFLKKTAIILSVLWISIRRWGPVWNLKTSEHFCSRLFRWTCRFPCWTP